MGTLWRRDFGGGLLLLVDAGDIDGFWLCRGGSVGRSLLVVGLLRLLVAHDVLRRGASCSVVGCRREVDGSG